MIFPWAVRFSYPETYRQFLFSFTVDRPLLLFPMDAAILEWFSHYAYSPCLVYTAMIVLMFLSSLGLPLPEEVTLLSTGLVAYMGANPDKFPPPYPDAHAVDPYVAAVIAFFAVFLSDYVIFFLGRNFGEKILQKKFMKKYEDKIMKISTWTQRYGFWASGIFRFTPGLRFPGHFAVGMMKVSSLKFTLVDGTAALLSVPTQILLIAFYGDAILASFQKYKIIFFGVMGIVFALYIAYWFFFKRGKDSSASA